MPIRTHQLNADCWNPAGMISKLMWWWDECNPRAWAYIITRLKDAAKWGKLNYMRGMHVGEKAKGYSTVFVLDADINYHKVCILGMQKTGRSRCAKTVKGRASTWAIMTRLSAQESARDLSLKTICIREQAPGAQGRIFHLLYRWSGSRSHMQVGQVASQSRGIWY